MLGDSLKVKDAMNPNVVVGTGEMNLVSAFELMVKCSISALPVIDKDRFVIGVLRKKDFISQTGAIHLPTLISMLKKIDVNKKDMGPLRRKVEELFSLKLKDIVKKDTIGLSKNEPLRDAVRIFLEFPKYVPIPILDAEKKLVGILGTRDVLKLFGFGELTLANEKMYNSTISQKLNEILLGINKEYVLVSQFRARNWIIFSAIFMVLGFVVAFAMILRM